MTKQYKRLWPAQKALAKTDNPVCVWCNRMIWADSRYKHTSTKEIIWACTDTHAAQAFELPNLRHNRNEWNRRSA